MVQVAAGESEQRHHCDICPVQGPTNLPQRIPLVFRLKSVDASTRAGRLTIGRGDVDIKFDERMEHCSRVHAELFLIETIVEGKTSFRMHVFDCGSSNGTFLNGVCVGTAPLDPKRLAREDACSSNLVEMGDTLIFGGSHRAATGTALSAIDASSSGVIVWRVCSPHPPKVAELTCSANQDSSTKSLLDEVGWRLSFGEEEGDPLQPIAAKNDEPALTAQLNRGNPAERTNGSSSRSPREPLQLSYDDDDDDVGEVIGQKRARVESQSSAMPSRRRSSSQEDHQDAIEDDTPIGDLLGHARGGPKALTAVVTSVRVGNSSTIWGPAKSRFPFQTSVGVQPSNIHQRLTFEADCWRFQAKDPNADVQQSSVSLPMSILPLRLPISSIRSVGVSVSNHLLVAYVRSIPGITAAVLRGKPVVAFVIPNVADVAAQLEGFYSLSLPRVALLDDTNIVGLAPTANRN